MRVVMDAMRDGGVERFFVYTDAYDFFFVIRAGAPRGDDARANGQATAMV